MSLATASMILLSGISLVLLHLSRWRAAQAAAIGALGLGAFALIGSAYGALDLYAIPGFSTVSVLTSVAFSAIGFGLLVTITERGGYEIVRSLRPGPVLARQLWLPNALVVIFIGALVEKAQSRGLLGPRADSAIFAVLIIVLTSILFWATGRRLNRLDDGLRETTLRYQCLSECTQVIVHSHSIEELLPRVCATLVKRGKFEQAWAAAIAADGTIETPMTFGPAAAVPDALARSIGSGAEVTDMFAGLPVLACPADLEGRSIGVVAVQLPQAREWLASERRLIDQVAETLASGLQRLAAEAQVRASEARFAGILSSAMDAIVSVDRDQRVVIFNRGAERMFGYGAGQIVGEPIDRLLPERFRVVHREHVLAFGKSEVKTRSMSGDAPLLALRADGTEFPIEASISKVGSGPETVYTAIIRDVTEQRRSAEEIRRFASTLEVRVAERTSQLEAANRELEAFSYSVSHDLRAPLRSMDGFALAVIEDYGHDLPAEGLHFLNRIRQGARRLGTLVDDLLALSRLGRQSLVRSDVDMERLVRDCLAELNLPAIAPGATIVVQPMARADADAALIRQVWINLLANAVKFSRGSERPQVEVGSVEQGGHPVWYVRDNGVGFDMKYAAKLFGVFQRLHLQHEFEGTGVGLAIVDRIVQRHGGAAWADSRPGEGATFYFTLAPEVLS
jgi:PAS domain S-box-containing protein